MTFIQGIAIVHALIAFAFSLRILLRDDLTSAARLAWFMVMVFAPYAGLVVYLLFGEISLGRSIHGQHGKIFAKLRQIAGRTMGSCDENLDSSVETEYQTAFRAASIDGFQTTLGNRAELLEHGVNIFEFRNDLLHAKTLTVDGVLSLIVSTNLDLRSFDLN